MSIEAPTAPQDLTAGLTTPRGTDYYLLAELLTDSEREIRDQVRAFVDTQVLPIINDYWERAQFPFELVPKIAQLGIVGGAISGYGCPGLSRLAAGMVTLELSRGDGSVNTFLGVQNGLAMGSINMLGSEEQKQRWLPAMARLDKVGAFALTEPGHGSDSVGLETTAPTVTTGSSTAPSGGSGTATSRTSSSSGPGTSPTARSRASWWRRPTRPWNRQPATRRAIPRS
jgi:alkylation response protein AidB-like acyl-CoA dehydrogenase